MFSALHVLALSLLALSPSEALFVRGGKPGLPNVEHRLNDQCEGELGLEIVCQPDCNFTARKGTCEAKAWIYHGGPCRVDVGDNTVVNKALGSPGVDVVCNCTDFNQGPPSTEGDKVFVVISDVGDPSKNSSNWTTVGGFFGTDYHDYPIGDGLGDAQNITFYSSEEDISYENMLQTLIFTTPCEDIPWEYWDDGHSVQLQLTSLDPHIHASFELQVTSTSKPDEDWTLTSATAVLNVDPFFVRVPIDPLEANFGLDASASIPFNITIDRSMRELNLLATIAAEKEDGSVCAATTLHSISQEPPPSILEKDLYGL